jgi:sugar phosphate isomerase/epimerase
MQKNGPGLNIILTIPTIKSKVKNNMKLSICHYSFHNSWKNENWDCSRLAREVKALGVGGVDFHAGMTGDPKTAPKRILAALSETGLTLTGLSLSNNFNVEGEDLDKQLDNTRAWMAVAAEVKAPVSRIFGGHIHDRGNPELMRKALDKITSVLSKLAKEAEKLGVTLALENHGGLPCTGEEQVAVIEKINSPFLKATVDIGNYMQAPQEGHAGVKIAAKHAAYVHVKDFKKLPPKDGKPGLLATVIGEGDVRLKECLKGLRDAGYKGWYALEYEAAEPEKTAVPRSIANILKAAGEI